MEGLGLEPAFSHSVYYDFQGIGHQKHAWEHGSYSTIWERGRPARPALLADKAEPSHGGGKSPASLWEGLVGEHGQNGGQAQTRQVGNIEQCGVVSSAWPVRAGIQCQGCHRPPCHLISLNPKCWELTSQNPVRGDSGSVSGMPRAGMSSHHGEEDLALLGRLHSGAGVAQLLPAPNSASCLFL